METIIILRRFIVLQAYSYRYWDIKATTITPVSLYIFVTDTGSSKKMNVIWNR